jgi:AraC-like DNA-binding protein
MSPPCYSARFIAPFAQLLAGYESYPAKSLEALKAIDADTRIPMREAHNLAFGQVAHTGDLDLGLKAARITPFGRGGVVDYAMHTAATVRESLEVGSRYAHVFCDAASIKLMVEGKRATVRFESTVPVPKLVSDFAISVWYLQHVRGPIGEGGRLECLFANPKPQRTTEYDRTFTQASLRFGAPFDGFSFSSDCLDAPLPSADSTLHVVISEHLAVANAQLSKRRTFAASVHDIATRDLLSGYPSAPSIAHQMSMSVRTLARRLEREGTTFSSILDQVRQELALRYVGSRNMPLAEVALRLRFSHPEGFHRAFKRWTGQTPHAYRLAREHRNGAR